MQRHHPKQSGDQGDGDVQEMHEVVVRAREQEERSDRYERGEQDRHQRQGGHDEDQHLQQLQPRSHQHLHDEEHRKAHQQRGQEQHGQLDPRRDRLGPAGIRPGDEAIEPAQHRHGREPEPQLGPQLATFHHLFVEPFAVAQQGDEERFTAVRRHRRTPVWRDAHAMQYC